MPLSWNRLSENPGTTRRTLSSVIEQAAYSAEAEQIIAQLHHDQAEIAFEWFCETYGITIPDDPGEREQLRLSLLASIRAAYADDEEEGTDDD